MLTLITGLSFAGFFLLYNSSKKVRLRRSSLPERWAQDHPKAGKGAALLLLATACVGSMLFFGPGSGIFAFSVIVMTVASLTVLLAPLQYVGYKAVVSLFLLSVTVEFIFS